jgi:hypothetical protein
MFIKDLSCRTGRLRGERPLRGGVYLVSAMRGAWGLALLGTGYFLDAVIVTSPVDDVLLDGFGFEVLGEGLTD